MKQYVFIVFLLTFMQPGSANTVDFAYSGTEESIILFDSGDDTLIHDLEIIVEIDHLTGYIVNFNHVDFDAISVEKINGTGVFHYSVKAGKAYLSLKIPNRGGEVCGFAGCVINGNYTIQDNGVYTQYKTVDSIFLLPLLLLPIILRKFKKIIVI